MDATSRSDTPKSQYCVTLGPANDIAGLENLTTGIKNHVNGQGNIVIGNNNVVEGNNNVVLTSGQTIKGNNQTVIGSTRLEWYNANVYCIGTILDTLATQINLTKQAQQASHTQSVPPNSPSDGSMVDAGRESGIQKGKALE